MMAKEALMTRELPEEESLEDRPSGKKRCKMVEEGSGSSVLSTKVPETT